MIRALAGARMAEGAWQFGGALDIAGVLAFVVVTVTTIVIAGRPRTDAKPAAGQAPQPSPEAAK